MCSHVIVDGVDCFSVEELVFEIGSEDFIVKDRSYQFMPRGAMCLCGVDLPATAKAAGFNCSRPDDSDCLYVFESMEREMTLKPGDVVMLKSGGPLMTVREVGDANLKDHPVITCNWMSGNDLHSARFAVVCLKLVSKTEPPEVENGIEGGANT